MTQKVYRPEGKIEPSETRVSKALETRERTCPSWKSWMGRGAVRSSLFDRDKPPEAGGLRRGRGEAKGSYGGHEALQGRQVRSQVKAECKRHFGDDDEVLEGEGTRQPWEAGSWVGGGEVMGSAAAEGARPQSFAQGNGSSVPRVQR